VRRTTITSLGTQVREREDRLRRAHAVCAACTGCAPAEPIQCESLDCAWLYERHKAGTGMELAQFASQLLEELQGAGSEQADSEGEQNTWQGRPRLERNGSSSGSEMLR
jgi:DNA polymerase zeta